MLKITFRHPSGPCDAIRTLSNVPRDIWFFSESTSLTMKTHQSHRLHGTLDSSTEGRSALGSVHNAFSDIQSSLCRFLFGSSASLDEVRTIPLPTRCPTHTNTPKRCDAFLRVRDLHTKVIITFLKNIGLKRTNLHLSD